MAYVGFGRKEAARLIMALFGCVALQHSSPAAAKPMPAIEEIADDAQQQWFSQLSQPLFDQDPSNDKAVVRQLDERLAAIREPSALRGMVQMLRALALANSDERAGAAEAIEESITLLPGYSGPLITATTLYAFTDRPEKAADYLLRASRIDPHLVLTTPEYVVTSIISRLGVRRERRRIRILSERLLEIGWTGESVSGQTRLAVNAIEARIADGEVAAARPFISKLLVPSTTRSLLFENRFEPIWRDLEVWAGAKLEKQWPLYLQEARARWQASNEDDALLDYFHALNAASHEATILWEVWPFMSGALDPEEDAFVFLISPMARILAEHGRWQDVDDLFGRAMKAWPLGSNPNALNVFANRARYLAYRGRMDEAIEAIDVAIADTGEWGGEVNEDALAAMHMERACYLYDLNREQEAAASIAIASNVRLPVQVATLYACLGRHDDAVNTLLVALDLEETRGDVLAAVQVSTEVPIDSDYWRKTNAQLAAIRTDPRLLAKASKFGRILPWRLDEGAPAEGAAQEERSTDEVVS